MSQLSDFIDRAKLEALAAEHAPDVDQNTRLAVLRASKRESFLAGAAAYAALLDAETTEEWGVADEVNPILVYTQDMHGGAYSEASARNESMARTPREYVVSRRVTQWLPSEGGEKRG